MPNFDGLNELRFFYTTIPTGFSPLEHRMSFDVALSSTPVPGEPFGELQTVPKAGPSTMFLDEWVDSFMPFLLDLHAVSTEFSRVELWRIPEGTTDATFISVYPLGDVGTGGSSQVAQQITFTARSGGGGIARLQLMEGSLGGNSSTSYPYGAEAQAFADAIVADSSIILARDNTYLLANNKLSLGQNEALWRRRFRS